MVYRRPHRGVVHALNEAFASSKWQMITRLDSDDSQHLRRLEKQVKYLLTHHQHPDMVICRACPMDEQGNVDTDYWRLRRRSIRTPGRVAKNADKRAADMQLPVAGAWTLSWRHVWEQAGDLRDDEEPAAETGWECRARLAGNVSGTIDDDLYYYRRRPGQRYESGARCRDCWTKLPPERRGGRCESCQQERRQEIRRGYMREYHRKQKSKLLG